MNVMKEIKKFIKKLKVKFIIKRWVYCMNKNIKIVLISVMSILIIMIIGSILFYYPSYTTANNLIKSANTGYEQNFEGSELINKEDYKKLQVVETIKNPDDYYINGGTFVTVKSIGIGEIEYSCNATYEVINIKTTETECQVQKKYSLKFEFNNGWKVKDVSGI